MAAFNTLRSRLLLVLSITILISFCAPSMQVADPAENGDTDQPTISLELSLDQQLRNLIEQEVARQEDARFRQFRWFAAVIGLVGLGTFGTLASYLIEKAVERSIERRTGSISESLAFSRFYTIALKLGLDERISRADIDAIMSYLRRVEKKSETRHSPEFLASLQQVASSFASAGRSAEMDEIFQIYEREILASPELVQPLLHHYGQEIVSREKDDENSLGYLTFKKLERIAPSALFPELALAYRTLYASKKATPGSQKEVAALIERSVLLNNEDRRMYLHEIFRRSRTTNWVRITDPEVGKIESVVRSFVAAHSEALKKVYDLNEEAVASIADSGLSEEESAELSNQMASKYDA